MASTQATVDELLDCLAAVGRVSARKMFGEYCIYLNDKPIALVCDDQFFVKPTAEGRELVPGATEAPPYPKAKPHLLIARETWADREALCRLVSTTYQALPAPKPKKPKRKT